MIANTRVQLAEFHPGLNQRFRLARSSNYEHARDLLAQGTGLASHLQFGFGYQGEFFDALFRNHAARDPVARVAGGVRFHIIGFRVDNNGGTTITVN
jgi:hypothetical protein